MGRLDGISKEQPSGNKVHTFDGNIGFESNDNNAASFLRTTYSSSLGELRHVTIDVTSKSISNF